MIFQIASKLVGFHESKALSSDHSHPWPPVDVRLTPQSGATKGMGKEPARALGGSV